VRRVAAQTTERRIPVTRVGTAYRMAHDGVTTSPATVEANLRGLAVVRKTHRLTAWQRNLLNFRVDLHVGLVDAVAAQTKHVGLGTHLTWEVTGVRVVTDHASSRPVRTMHGGRWLNLVAHGTEFAGGGNERDRSSVVFRSCSMTTVTA
jgi:hypothetical protein